MPPDILENILAIRLETIRKLLDIPYSLVAKFKNNKHELCQVRWCCPDRPACGALMYESVLRGLEKRKLWPLKDPKQILTNVFGLARNIEEIGNGVKLSTRHADIYNDSRHDFYHDLSFKNKVFEVMKSMSSPVSEAHLRHMTLQGGAKK
jgi:hypothetical protein